MTQNFRCPRCRSLIRLVGNLDFFVPAIQELICPVCGQKWWVASGFPSYRWRTDKILKCFEPATPLIDTEKIPKEYQKPVLQFKLPEPFKEAGKGLYNISIWIVVVLILIFLIKRR